MLRLFRLVLATALLHAGCAAADTTLRFGIDLNYPPFSSLTRNGVPEGFDVDIANALCKEMQVRCRIVPQDWDGLIKALDMGKYDAILSSMQITPERQRLVDFTDTYYRLPSRMIAARGQAADPDSFRNKTLAVLKDSTQEAYARASWGRHGARILRYTRIPAAFEDLAAGRIAGVFVDAAVGEHSFLGTPQGRGFSFVGSPVDDPRYFGPGAGIAVRKGDTRLRVQLNQALKRLHEDGTYRRISQQYFSFDLAGQ